MEDSAKNSAILQEYHQLYELQRQRLEKQIQALTFERDIWNSTAYSLGLKLIEGNFDSSFVKVYKILQHSIKF